MSKLRVKPCLAALSAAILLASCRPTPSAPAPAQAAFEPIHKACAGREGWSDKAPPAHVFGNTYMVGTCGIVVLLVTSPKGHFLIDGAMADAAQGIAENIRALGFDPKDVRYLLSSHEHLDHAGGLAELKRITGAKFVTRAEAQVAMESGAPHPSDPQLGLIPHFEGVKADLILKDGAALHIGKQALAMVATPGHTPGGTSWMWTSCEGKSCRTIVYSDSLNAVSAPKYRFTDHPEYVATLRASMARIEAMKPCDILIGPHPAQSNFFERLAGEAPLVDGTGCKSYAESARKRLDARLTQEAAK